MPVRDRALHLEVADLPQGLLSLDRNADGFLPAGRVDCLLEMLGDLKAIVDDRRPPRGGVGRLPRGRDKIGVQIHRSRFDQTTLFRRQLSSQRHRRRSIASLHHLQHPGLLQLGDPRHVAPATKETLLAQLAPP